MVATSSSNDVPRQPPVQAEIRDMLSTLSGHLTALGRSIVRSDANSPEADGVGHGFGIITLAGDNKGATMKADMEELLDTLHDEEDDGGGGMHTYTNSNYQAVNNSILVGGSCRAEDPGVHVVISEYIEEDEEDLERHVKKEKKKEKGKKKKEKEEKKKKKKEKDEDVDEEEEDEEEKEKRQKDEK